MPPTVAAETDEERAARPRRGRRGRGGRGREGREERPGADVAAQVDREAADITPVDFVSPDRDTAAAEATTRVERPRGEQHSRPAAIARIITPDVIGESGERLTRDEAFQLVRQAVESLTTNEDDAVRASDVRVRARELLGRDSESLGERMFTRILRDAHDADMIDLRRRGDDFEVARAVAAPSVREQLVRAESAATPATTAGALSNAAAARRGMGPRGATGRGGRGRPSGPPPDLFAVGVIEDPATLTTAAPPPGPVAVEVDEAPPAAEPAAPPARTRTGAKRGARKAPAAAASSNGDGADASAPVAKKTARRGAKKSGAKRAAKKTAE
jgi:hypothetical protein